MSEPTMTTDDVHDVLWSALIDANDVDSDEHTYVCAALRALHEMLGGDEGIFESRTYPPASNTGWPAVTVLRAVLDAAEEEAKR